MWLTSQDDEFRQKRDDVLHLYYDTPANEHIVCVDEKTVTAGLRGYQLRRHHRGPVPIAVAALRDRSLTELLRDPLGATPR